MSFHFKKLRDLNLICTHLDSHLIIDGSVSVHPCRSSTIDEADTRQRAERRRQICNGHLAARDLARQDLYHHGEAHFYDQATYA